ncbi:hypothetical protein E4M02_02575 [Brevundimonas sp. S30B]|uniref:hypothetical protein n=1 Tax=unclassified Brevundimonas TaxID=2622653 RepID=UPI001072DC3D|nr:MULTISPECIES: hypothetical protein [unclassified Brevundimonas]QBX37225.1 hypothetical protein E4M01_05245 [Brevundimonas sp. MF30-B]TFW03981.1 hypothetical protein E4M02_02575 [Brevundimonas sp. S30B]
MKPVEFAKAWRWPTSATSYEEYPAGFSGEISNDRAVAADRAGVLKAEPKAPASGKSKAA